MRLQCHARGALLGAVAVLLLAAPASAEMGDWVEQEFSRIRLIAAGPDAGGVVSAAVEIELAAGWKTYWRNPGDAGLAPILDFEGSENLVSAEVGFPPPHRLDDGFSISNVYEGRVVFPITITTRDPNAPTVISLLLQIGVCDDVCIPAEFRSTISVGPGFTDAEAARIIADARALLPGPPVPGVIEVQSVRFVDGTEDEPVFELVATLPEGVSPEVFVEGPADWYAGVPIEISRQGTNAVYRVGFDRLGSVIPIVGAAFRMTIVTGDRAVEQSVETR